MAGLTPKERAELRRQKILAKKNARMAFVTGETKEPLTKAQPDQPCPSSSTPSADDPDLGSTSASKGASNIPIRTSVSSSAVAPVETAASTLRSSMFSASLTAPPDPHPSNLQNVQYFSLYRSLVITILAVGFAVSTRVGAVSGWRLSCIELFIYTRIALAIPFELRRSSRAAFLNPRGGSGFDLFSMLSSAANAYRSFECILLDFALYMTVFLCTHSVLSRL